MATRSPPLGESIGPALSRHTCSTMPPIVSLAALIPSTLRRRQLPAEVRSAFSAEERLDLG
jgi:hypothetical protein